MKKLLLIALTIICCSASAQQSKFTMSTFFSPAYAYRYTQSLYDFSEPVKRHRDSIDQHMFGFQAGQLLHYKPGKYITLTGGLAFSDMGHQQDIRYPIYDANGELLEEKTLNLFYHRTYIDIPLAVDIQFNTDRLSYYTSLGFEVNFLMNTYELALVDSEPIGVRVINLDEVPTLNLSIRAALGVNYLITPSTSLYGALFAKPQLKPINSFAFNEYDYLGGLMLGVRYNIN